MYFLERKEACVKKDKLVYQWKAIYQCVEYMPLKLMIDQMDLASHRITFK